MKPMSIWTREQISQVRGLRAQATLDQILMTRFDKADPHAIAAMTEVRMQLVRRLIDMAHAFVVEPHAADFQFGEAAGDQPWSTEIRCWWEPEVRTVEIRGGHMDGTLLEIERPGEPFKILAPMSPPSLTDEEAAHPTELVPTSLLVEMTGWDETRRHWVYEVKP